MSVTPAQLRSGYGPIYRYLSRCGDGLTPASKLVLLNLLERLGQKGMVWPSQETISGDTGFSDTTIRKALGELSALGFIAQHRRGRGQTNEYTVAIDVVLAWAEKGNCFGSRTEDSSEQEPKNLRTEDPPEKIHQGSPIASQGETTARRITEAFRAEMRQEFPDLDEAAEFDKATNHIAYRKAIDKRRYYRNWLSNARRFAAERRNHATNRNGHRPGAQSQFAGAGDSPRPGRAPDLVG